MPETAVQRLERSVEVPGGRVQPCREFGLLLLEEQRVGHKRFEPPALDPTIEKLRSTPAVVFRIIGERDAVDLGVEKRAV